MCCRCHCRVGSCVCPQTVGTGWPALAGWHWPVGTGGMAVLRRCCRMRSMLRHWRLKSYVCSRTFRPCLTRVVHVHLWRVRALVCLRACALARLRVHACVRACSRASLRPCVLASVRLCACVCACVLVHSLLRLCACACICTLVRALVRACTCVCMRLCVRLCVHVCVRKFMRCVHAEQMEPVS